MPKFKVCLQRYVEETAAIEVEADTLEAAIAAAEARTEDGFDGWVAGDDMSNEEPYAVLDSSGAMVWER